MNNTNSSDELHTVETRKVSLGTRVGDITYTFRASEVGPFREEARRRALSHLSPVHINGMDDAEAYGEALVAALSRAYPVTRITVRRLSSAEEAPCGVKREKGPGDGAWPVSDEEVIGVAKRVLYEMQGN